MSEHAGPAPGAAGSVATGATIERVPAPSGLPRLDGSLVVLTGGTRGIGLHAAAGLAHLGADVVITGRSGVRGERAVAAITGAVPGAAVRFVPTDLSTLAGVRTAAAAVRQEAAGPIDVLVHNAGVLLTTPARTADGFDLTVMVNHLAPFLLTHLLGPDLHRPRTRQTRVLIVTSGAARFARVDVDRLLSRHDPVAPGPGRRRAGFGAYGGSKALAALVAAEWSARWAADPAAPRVHLVDPGGANTSLVDGMTDATSSPLVRALFRLVGPGRRSPATAARSTLTGAAAAELDDAELRWIGAGGRIGAPPRRLRDPSLRRVVWDRTTELAEIDRAYPHVAGGMPPP